MNKIIKYIFSIILFLPLFYLTIINYKLYHSPNHKTEGGLTYNTDQLKHLRFLKTQMEQDAAKHMQNIYPEGYVFTYALYGMAWAEFAEKIKDKTHPIYNEAFLEVDKAISNIFSPEGTKVFPKEQALTYGAYYSGWSNYLLGKKILLNPNRNDNDIKEFKNKCEEIASAIQENKSPYLESYRGSAWPADMTVAVASIALHDRIFPAAYQNDINLWIQKVNNNLDPNYKMIPHVEIPRKESLSPRGSSMSLMLCFLPEIDSDFSNEQFKKYKDGFLTYRFGLPGIREHHKSNPNTGADIDSGPVILSVGGSASIVGQKVFALHGEKNIAKGIRNSIEGFGLGWEGRITKNYLFGKLSIADAFIAWVNGTDIESLPQKNTRWRWKFQLISLFIYLIFGWSISLIWKKKVN